MNHGSIEKWEGNRRPDLTRSRVGEKRHRETRDTHRREEQGAKIPVSTSYQMGKLRPRHVGTEGAGKQNYGRPLREDTAQAEGAPPPVPLLRGSHRPWEVISKLAGWQR